MPPDVFLTYAKDYAIESTKSLTYLVDVNSFGRFHTFQLQKPLGDHDLSEKEKPSGLSTRFSIPSDQAQNGLIFRLRAELITPSSNSGVRQGLRVSLIEEASGIIAEASTLEQHEVVLQYDNIEQGKEYTIRYDLYDREISVGTTTQNGECQFPYITQQMLIMDKRLVQHRIDSYLADQTLSETDLQKDGLICDFGSLSNENTVFSFFNIESILYCDTHTYTYNSQKSLQNTVLYSRDFQVKGLNSTGRTLITYWFDMSIALNFMASSGFKVLLAKGDFDYEKSQFACLRDHSCVMAHMSDKNVLRVEAILTSGNYKIMIIDYNTEDSYAMLSAMRKPVNIKIQANTIIQNEERVNCPYLYLEEDFIQSKFLDGMAGQKFSFQDTIIMNVFNLSQPISLKPERDMLLKVLVKESFGVNSELSLTDGDAVIAKSVQMGSTEILVYQRLKKGVTYTLTLSYFNSIIQMAQFYQCPSLPIEVTMIECDEAEAVAREHGKISDEENFKTEEALNRIFNTIDGLRSKQREIWEDGYTFTNHSVVFNSQLNLEKSQQIVISRLFTVGPERMQLLAEIYFEPYLLYTLDVSIKSKDIEKMHHQQVSQQSSEGSKRILVELEPGDYEFMITYKSPITRDNNTFPIPESIKYQLMIVYDDLIDRQQILPPSLNYYGMLGPQGRDFGQMVYFCGDCIMEYSQFKVIEFQSYSEINFDAIISSPTNSLEVKLEEVNTEEGEDAEQKDTYYKSFEKAVKKGKSVGSRLIRDRGKKSLQREEVIKANKLSGMKKYRVVITVKNTDIDLAQEYKFNLRIEIQEKPKEYKWLQSQFDILPKSIEEIARYKLKNEGMKESDFLVASATTLNFLDENKLHPFLRKTQGKVYQMNIDSKITEDGSFLYYLPFTIDTEEAIVYASVYDYSGQAGLGVNILKDSSDEEEESFEAVSIPGKYFNFIPPLALSKGTYYLGILPQTTITQSESTLIRFSLDLLIEKEDTARGFSNELLEGAMQFCNLPQNPRYLSSPAYMHPLSGQSVSTIISVKASVFISGDMIELEIKDDTNSQSQQQMTMVQAYVEFPRDMRLEMSIMKGYNVLKQKASWEDLNSESENFLKTKTFQGKNYIQIREVIAGKGLYRILIKGQDTKGMGLLEQYQRCETLKISLNIYPINPIAKKSKLTDLCPQAHGFENQLDFAKDLRGEVNYSTSANILDTTYISTQSSIFGMPPYLFYVNLQYDMALQGPISIALFKYDKETLQFEEDELFTSHQHGSQLLARIEDDGTYIIAIQSLTSTVDVFNLDTKIRYVQRPVLFKPCINIKYEAIISSMAEESFYTNLNFEQITTLERLLPEKQQSCMLDTMPESFPVSETGFDISYNLPFEQKPEDLVDIVTSGNQPSLLKVMIYSYKNPQSNINAFLYKNQAALEPPYNANASLARSVLTFDEKVLFAILPQQRQPYKLKVIYDTSLNQKDCNTFLMRAAQKDLQTVISDNLQCTGLGMPPEQIDVDKDVFDFEGSFEVSSEFLLKFKQNSDITYDIRVKVPSSTQQYFFDIETKSDYLVSDVETELYLNEMYLGDTNFVPQREHQNGLAVKRMKADCAKDQVGEMYVIRITFSRLMVKLATYLKDQTKEPLCFAFDLSLRVSKPMFEETYYERETEANENELVRIDWESQHAHNAYTIGGGLIVDPSQKVIGYLEFKESLKESITLARSDYFIRLVPLNETEGGDISVQNQRLSPFDSSTLIVEIAHNTLKPVGYCYRVELVGATFISRHNSEDTTIPGQIICTTKCEGCNPSGTKGCDETQGKCLCNSVFTGDRCDQCIPGHIMDPATKLCNPENKCKSEGGKEDCNGHGECVTDPQNGQAMCLCDPGFENDGLDLCGKCEDAFFQYPNCMQRFWAVLMGSYNCMDMQTEMPTYLYKQNNEEKVYQQADGSLYWNALYRLDSGMRKKQQHQQSFISEHFFKVPQGDNGILRVFLDTHDSQGIKNVEVRILNGEKRIMHDTREKESSIVDTSESSKTFFMMLEQEEDESQKPWTIEFQYQMDSQSQTKDIEYTSTQCPFIEVIVILQPFTKLQDYLTCTSPQHSHLLDSENLPALQLSENFKYHTMNFTLTSSDALKQQKNPSFYILSQNLSISQLSKDVTHALSIFTSYSFESVHVQMSLRDTITGSVIAIDRLSYIEEVEVSDQQQYGNLDKHDMLSLIEVQDIPAGQYTLDIAIDKAMFIPMKNTRTCLEFDLTIEYVTIPKTKDPNRYDIISIMPQKAKGLTNSSEIKIIVTFSKELILEDLIPGGNFNQDLGRLCYMQNKNTHLDAKKAFMKNEQVIEFYYNFRGVEITEECFTLKCGVVSGNYFTTFQEATSDASIGEITIENEYCLIGSKNLNCNPKSMPRIVDGLCKCIYPYTGPTCEQCDSGFIQTTDSNSHTVCTVDISRCNNGDVCHNHGRCEKTNNEFVSCNCDDKYSGRFCERCKNRADTYPDCDGEVQFAEKALPAYMTRQKYSNNEKAITKDEQQCLFSNYPKDLNRLEYMQFLPQSGDFHIADIYTVNHNSDNVITFKAPSIGEIKILVQKPELESLSLDDEAFDFEIGIYDLDNDKFLATSTNQYIDLDNHQEGLIKDKESVSIDGKLDFSVLTFKIPDTLVNQTLQIRLRTANTTESSTPCTTVYLELQFKSGPPPTSACQQPQNVGQLISSNDIIRISNPFTFFEATHTEYFIHSMTPHFFYYQDFYIESDIELHISMYQKFTDQALVDFVVEILEMELDEPQTNFFDTEAPQCINNPCFIGGQKAYNEFHNYFEIGPKTVFRVWFFKHTEHGANDCGKFQVQLEFLKPQLKPQGVQKCSALDFPLSLNTSRYSSNQFHYLESFRVDNLPNNTHHTVEFTLTEPSMVRFVSVQHRHIEFDFELYSGENKLVSSGAKGFEDSIYAQLDKGRYQLKVIFLSEAYYMKQPCQTIEMEIGIDTLSNVRDQVFKEADNTKQISKFDGSYQIVSPKIKTQAYLLNKEETKSLYKSYEELEIIKFTIPDDENLGLLIELKSNFLTADVSLGLSKGDQFTHQQRFYNSKKLAVSNLQGGYELMVYAHQALSNLNSESDLIQDALLQYEINWQFVKLSEIDDFSQHSIEVTIYGNKVTVPLITLDSETFSLMSSTFQLPSTLTPLTNDGALDIDTFFLAQPGEHPIILTPHQDSLSVIIYEANSLSQLYQNDKLIQESISANGEISVLTVNRLYTGEVYRLVLVFDEETTTEPIRIQIKSFDYNEACNRELAAINDDNNLVIASDQSKSVTVSSASKKSAQGSIELKDGGTLEVDIDTAQVEYMPVFKLAWKKLPGGISPSDIDTSISGIIRYTFTDLKASTYTYTISQIRKPNSCSQSIHLTFKSYSSNSEIDFQSEVYQSIEEIEKQNRYREPLPLFLDTYKFLKDQHDYVLVSEYLQMQPSNPESNIIKFTIDNDQTLVKFNIETPHITMTLRDQFGQTVSKATSPILQSLLQKGTYDLHFEYATFFASTLQQTSAFHLSILILEQQFLTTKILLQTVDSHSECASNKNFPLSLNRKKTSIQDEISYDYQLLRLSGEVVSGQSYLDRYAFRINETSRFYVALGYEAMAANVRLRLTDLKEGGISWIGGQMFGQSVIDDVIGSGDYALIIEQAEIPNGALMQQMLQGTNYNKLCSLFSLSGLITPIIESGQGNGLATDIGCPIKEVFPSKIYKSSADTKDGMENYINQDGTYTRVFRRLLVKKSLDQSRQYDTISLESPHPSLLSVLVQYPHHQTVITPLLTYSYSQTQLAPLASTHTLTSHGFIEATYLFTIDANTGYRLHVMYQGEVGKRKCEYYNALISINTVERATEELTCLPEADTKDVRSLVNEIPDKIDEGSYQDYIKVVYPKDFTADMLNKSISIYNREKDPIEIEVDIKFDYPYSMFAFQLVEHLDEDDGDDEPVVQNPLMVDRGDDYSPVLNRKIHSSRIEPKKQYSLQITDQLSFKLMEYISQQSKLPQLCIYSEFSLTLSSTKPTQQLFQSSASLTPQILSVSPQPPYKGGNLLLQQGANQIQLTVAFSSIPFLISASDKQRFNPSDFSKLVSLQVFHPDTSKLLRAIPPMRITNSTNQGVFSVRLIFSLKDELDSPKLFSLALNPNKTVDSRNRPFTMAKNVRLPNFLFEGSQSQDTSLRKKNEATKVTGEIDQIKQKETKKKEQVKCLCVHGKCKQGESQCYKCDMGWTGTLCDITLNSAKVVNQEKGDKKWSNVRKDGSRLNRERRDDDGEETRKVYKEVIAAKTTRNSIIDRDTQTKIKQIYEESSANDQTNEEGFFSYLFYLFQWAFIIGIAGYLAFKILENRRSLSQYMPVNLNDFEAEPLHQDFNQLTELTDYKQPQKHQSTPGEHPHGSLPMNTQSLFSNIRNQQRVKSPPQPQNQQSPMHLQEESDRLFEEQTKQLSSELQLYSQEEVSGHNPFDEYVEHTRVQPEHDIDSVLQEMEEFTADANDDDNEFSKFV